jgi:chorismate mutase
MQRVAVLAVVMGRDVRLTMEDRAADGLASEETPEALARIRADIEQIDREIVGHIVRRVVVTRAAGFVKREAGLPVVDRMQEREVLARTHALADEAGLPYPEMRELMRHIIAVCRRAQVLDVAWESDLETL